MDNVPTESLSQRVRTPAQTLRQRLWHSTPMRKVPWGAVRQRSRISRGDLFASLAHPAARVIAIGRKLDRLAVDLAQYVGSQGHVTVFDQLKERAEKLKRRAHRRRLSHRITVHHHTPATLLIDDLETPFDVAWVETSAIEVIDEDSLFYALFGLVKPGGQCLLPTGQDPFDRTAFKALLTIAENNGFDVVGRPDLD